MELTAGDGLKTPIKARGYRLIPKSASPGNEFASLADNLAGNFSSWGAFLSATQQTGAVRDASAIFGKSPSQRRAAAAQQKAAPTGEIPESVFGSRGPVVPDPVEARRARLAKPAPAPTVPPPKGKAPRPQTVLRLHPDRKPGGALGHKHRLRKPDETLFIVLHETTTRNEQSDVDYISRKGKAHFTIGRKGTIYETLGERQVAHHAGVSMWNGFGSRKHGNTINQFSIGIEIVGFAEDQPTPAQNAALRRLLAYLMDEYEIDDDNVIGHTHVAYAKAKKRRGRIVRPAMRGRREDMIEAADDGWRALVGLRPLRVTDQDVAEGRLKAGDPVVRAQLYGNANERQRVAQQVRESREKGVIGKGMTAFAVVGRRYNHPTTRYTLPGGQQIYGDNEDVNWGEIPPGTRVETDVVRVAAAPTTPRRVASRQTTKPAVRVAARSPKESAAQVGSAPASVFGARPEGRGRPDPLVEAPPRKVVPRDRRGLASVFGSRDGQHLVGNYQPSRISPEIFGKR